MPVRIGVPQGVSGLADVVRNPIHATGVGLLLFGQKNEGPGNGLTEDGRGTGSVGTHEVMVQRSVLKRDEHTTTLYSRQSIRRGMPREEKAKCSS